jgi:tetratricopeptide (TPR) repeat protein
MMLGILVLVGTGPAPASANLDDAELVFNSGDYDRALGMYDEVLNDDPDSIRALVRSGMLLSWQSKYEEAIERYDRVLTIDPGNESATLERAKVCSWAKRYREAIAGFSSLLAKYPDDVDARLGLARSLSWSGEQDAARAEYEAVLGEEPRNSWALLGVAQTHAWSGRPYEAREWYYRALQIQPQMKEAALGLAYLDLGSGNMAVARGKWEQLDRRYPDDREIGELGRALRRAAEPHVHVSYDKLDDTEENELGIYRVEVGNLLPSLGNLRVGYTRYDMSDPVRSSSVDSVFGFLGVRPAQKHYVNVRLGVDRRSNSAGLRDEIAIGGLAYRWDMSPHWNLSLSAQRDTFRYSTAILDSAGNTIKAYDLVGQGKLAKRWRLRAGAGYWGISDGNERQSADLLLTHRWSIARTNIDLGYQFRYLEFSEDLNNGYFDPSDFTAHLAHLRVWGPFGSSRAYYDVTMNLGEQSFILGDTEVSGDQVFSVHCTAGYPLGAGLAIQLYASHSDYALQSASGFASDQLGLRLRWQVGDR